MTTERKMHSKIVGVTFDNRQENIEPLTDGQKLFVQHDINNAFDANALQVFADEQLTKPLGYLKKELAKDLQEQGTKGWKYEYFLSEKTGGGKNKSWGVNVLIIATHD